MAITTQQTVPGPGFTVTEDLVNHPNPRVRASQAQNLNKWLRWASDILQGWISASTAALFAPSDATYVCITTDPTLTAERRLAVTVGVHLSDAGPNAAATLSLLPMDEVPTGTVNGINDTFTLSAVPVFGILSQDGVVLDPGGIDYTRTGTSLVYVTGKIPAATSSHRFRGLA